MTMAYKWEYLNDADFSVGKNVSLILIAFDVIYRKPNN